METLIEKLLAIFRVERTTVGHERAGFSDVTGESLLLELELVTVLDPTNFVVLQRIDEPCGGVHLFLRCSCSGFEFSLFGL
jgi:hypothetical protein